MSLMGILPGRYRGQEVSSSKWLLASSLISINSITWRLVNEEKLESLNMRRGRVFTEYFLLHPGKDSRIIHILTSQLFHDFILT